MHRIKQIDGEDARAQRFEIHWREAQSDALSLNPMALKPNATQRRPSSDGCVINGCESAPPLCLSTDGVGF